LDGRLKALSHAPVYTPSFFGRTGSGHIVAAKAWPPFKPRGWGLRGTATGRSAMIERPACNISNGFRYRLMNLLTWQS
jgi:hypothetical protein